LALACDIAANYSPLQSEFTGCSASNLHPNVALFPGSYQGVGW